jgi:uncharacterized protein YbcI
MAEDFKALVEQATGRSVRSFISETDLENDIAVEVFLLSGARIDMAPFEQAGQDVPEEGSSG